MNKNDIGAMPATPYPDPLRWAFWGCFALLCLNALAFIHAAAAPSVKADDWRHLQEIIIPFLEGRTGIDVLWSNHHPVPLLHLIQIANINLLDLRLDAHAYMGLAFQAGYMLILVRCMLATTGLTAAGGKAAGACLLLTILLLAFGFNTLDQYKWPLLAAQQYLYFTGIVLLLFTDKSMRRHGLRQHWAVVLIALLFMLINADFGTLFLAATIACLLLAALLERSVHYLKLALLIAAVLISYQVLLKQFMDLPPQENTLNALKVAGNMLSNPTLTLQQYGLALSSGFLDIYTVTRHHPAAGDVLALLALPLALLYGAVIIAYLAKGLYRASIMPLALMLFALLFASSLYVFRPWTAAATDLWALAEDRYAPNYKLGIIGMLWSLWLLWRHSPRAITGRLNKIIGTLAVAATISLIAIQIHQINAGWLRVPAIRWANHNDELAIFMAGTRQENDIELPQRIHWAIWTGWRFDEALDYLVENRLNVFSPLYPDSPLLDRHRATRDAFLALPGGEVTHLTQAEQGPWQNAYGRLSPSRIVWRNFGKQPAHLRLRVAALSNSEEDTLLQLRYDQATAEKIRVYKGHQDLYFTVAPGHTLSISARPPTHFTALEHRPG